MHELGQDIFNIHRQLIPFSEQTGELSYVYKATVSRDMLLDQLDYVSQVARQRPEMSVDAKLLFGSVIQAIREDAGTGACLYVYRENEEKLAVSITQTLNEIDLSTIQDNLSTVLGFWGRNAIKCTIDDNGPKIQTKIRGAFRFTNGPGKTHQELFDQQLEKISDRDLYYLIYLFLTSIRLVAESKVY